MLDCFHMHWRWNGLANAVRIPFGSGAFIDPLVEPSDDSTFAPVDSGQPYLVPGQKIDMAIVKFDPSEQSKPIDDPLSLANNEIIATIVRFPCAPSTGTAIAVRSLDG